MKINGLLSESVRPALRELIYQLNDRAVTSRAKKQKAMRSIRILGGSSL
jgi:hypothetical protein